MEQILNERSSVSEYEIPPHSVVSESNEGVAMRIRDTIARFFVFLGLRKSHSVILNEKKIGPKTQEGEGMRTEPNLSESYSSIPPESDPKREELTRIADEVTDRVNGRTFEENLKNGFSSLPKLKK